MPFVEHRPSRTSLSDMADAINCVRISFKKKEDKKTQNSNVSLTIYIGKSLAEKLRLKGGDRVSFFYDDENKKKWLIKKSSQTGGYKLVDTSVSGGRVNYLRMQLTFKIPEFSLSTNDFSIRTVEHEIVDDGIVIYA